MSGIISIHSFRGGTGKSNITANTAVAMVQQGFRVGVIDTDIQSPGIHILFGLDEGRIEHTLNDYLWGKCAIEETAYDVSERLLLTSSLYLIPSSLRVGEIAKVLREGYEVGLLNDGFQALIEKLELDYLLIDTHPGLNEETLLSIAISDVLIIILRPDQQDYQGTAVTVDVARRLGVPAMYLVVNKVLPSFDASDVRKQLERSYGVPVLAVLPLSEEMVRLGSADIFSLRYPDHAFSRGIKGIAKALVKAEGGAMA